MLVAADLFVALLAWVGVMWVIAWSWDRHVQVYLAAGVVVPADQRPTIKKQAQRHTLGWTIFLVVFFLVLAVSAFPLWQLLGIAAVLSICYGVTRINREGAGRKRPRVSLFGETRDTFWYRGLAITEWMAFLASVAFAAQLVVEIFGV